MRKTITLVLVLFVMLFSLTGCGNNVENVEETTTTSKENAQTNETEELTPDNVDYAKAAEKQMAAPEAGEEIAIFHVKDFGEIKVKFFKDVAPKAVENFLTHAKNGYYNGVTFHRVINEFMIQGGDPTGTGTGGESIWGKGFPEEVSLELVPYRGTLCMASSGVGTSSLGSQFFITQANYDEAIYNGMKQGGWPQGILDQYKKYGGNIYSLYCQYTVFGQVFEGMEVVDKIAATKTGSVPMVINGVTYGTQDDKPVKDVIIEKIEVITQK